MASLLEFGAQLASVYRRKTPGRDSDYTHAPVTLALAARHDGHSLSKLVEREIIPRLMASHPVAYATSTSPDSAEITAEEVDGFAPLSLHVEAILRRGVGIDSILVDLLAPAARRLGEYWEDDRCDFVDVTMGLWRLQEIVHELGARLPADRQIGPGRRAIFASLSGDQHSFGTVVVEELFCREGWLTDRMSEATTPDLLERVAGEWFDLIGLTISCDSHIAQLPSVIAALRNVSRNPRLCVMLGGRIFVEDPTLAVGLGANGTARDAKVAVQVAVDMVDALINDAVV